MTVDTLTINTNLTQQGTGLNILPSGIITSYNSTTIPSGWVICDGTNNTPDLRDSFLLGSGSSLATKGGTNKSMVSMANMPNHTHIYNIHNTLKKFVSLSKLMVSSPYDYWDDATTVPFTTSSTSTIATNAGTPNGQQGTLLGVPPSAIIANLPIITTPPFYVLIFIMKL